MKDYAYRCLFLAMLASTGCTPRVAPQQLQALKEELAATKLQLKTTNERLDTLSRKFFLLVDNVEKNQVELSRTGPPRRLKVVKLLPGGRQRVLGSTSIRPSAAAVGNGGPRAQTRADSGKPPPAKQLYEHALGLYRARRYDDAEVQFLKFLSYYQKHQYSDNAYYWMGESRFDRKDYEGAVESFVTVLEKYPDGNKVPDALLKLAYAYQKMGRHEEALLTLKELAATYPRSVPGKKARAHVMELDPTEG